MVTLAVTSLLSSFPPVKLFRVDARQLLHISTLKNQKLGMFVFQCS